MVNYPIGDFLIRVKNAASAGKKEIVVANTKLIKAVSDVLKKEGYLNEVSKTKDDLAVTLAMKNKKPILMDIKLVSKPGLRVYMSADELDARRKASILILSTPKGVVSSRVAKKARVGGEVIAEVL